MSVAESRVRMSAHARLLLLVVLCPAVLTTGSQPYYSGDVQTVGRYYSNATNGTDQLPLENVHNTDVNGTSREPLITGSYIYNDSTAEAVTLSAWDGTKSGAQRAWRVIQILISVVGFSLNGIALAAFLLHGNSFTKSLRNLLAHQVCTR